MNLETISFARRIRAYALRMTGAARSSHIGSCLSAADILAVLFCDILRFDPERPDWDDRDRFIVSKGHAAAAVYAALAEAGFFPRKRLSTFCRDGTELPGHVTHKTVPGVELSTGSLGHGLPVACGMALAARRSGRSHRIFVLMSDGECDAGTTWEAALFAAQHQLDNLVVVVDYNHIQSLGRVEEVMNLEPFARKWASFGWKALEADGHAPEQLAGILEDLPFETGRPSCLIAQTVKGKGVSFMEDRLLWHYRYPREEDLRQAFRELGVEE